MIINYFLGRGASWGPSRLSEEGMGGGGRGGVSGAMRIGINGHRRMYDRTE